MQHALPDHLTGTLLEGRYELGPRIARGGTATVYRAVDTRLERVVAVKLMHGHLAEDPAAADRFVREARAAARLSHPHVVSVLDQGHAPDGVPYLVMEHVEGSTLRDLLRRRGALPPGEALALLEPVLDGLAAAHRAGLVHRDVKPENVLIAGTGRVTVADFGLTRAVDQHTATGTVLGTVGYASPELVTGRRVDTRADVYSAGIVLFELLTGRRPFEGGPVAVARAHAEGAVPDLRTLDPGVPAGVARLVAHATARDPELRPPDAGRFLEELRTVRAGLRPAELDRLPAPRAVHGAPPGPPAARDSGPTTALDPDARTTTALDPAVAPTEALGPAAAPTEALGPAVTRTGVPRPPGAPAGAGAPAGSGLPPPAPLPRGSSDPWRPAIELRPSRPLHAAGTLALVALAVAAAAFLGWLLGSGPGGTVSVPDVRGAGPELAEQYLAGAGLDNVAVHETADPVAPAGTVLGTDPQAGATVRAAEQVVLLVSTGPERTTAPDVTGMTEEDARARLEDAGLTAGTGTAVPDDAAPGTVVGQHPEAGTAVAAGTAVDLAVSRGPRADTAPGVLGRPVDEAVQVLAEAGYTARIEESLGAPFGYVVAQTTDGAEVVLTVL
ncbi:Stk1 family PASTA domain-containing Ser/Thr kinase [uncultured Kocuria sp.]|uniref:Stk1 family PASTA domain-containing Ser/Thr kinase n=1 Tax=uncultured Kocuria sp. TaxID=259305 RepID=UPI00261343BD|nr:Stk1 family PASTA domain-containing Ser/Thr kinase [uncultured Kocuria sp.]